MPHTFINCLLGQGGGVQHKWYQGSKSCLIYLAGVVFKMYCPALVDKSKAGQGTLVSISRNIIHRTKAGALVTKSYFNQDKGSISLLLTVGQISCNVQSLHVSSCGCDVILCGCVVGVVGAVLRTPLWLIRWLSAVSHPQGLMVTALCRRAEGDSLLQEGSMWQPSAVRIKVTTLCKRAQGDSPLREGSREQPSAGGLKVTPLCRRDQGTSPLQEGSRWQPSSGESR